MGDSIAHLITLIKNIVHPAILLYTRPVFTTGFTMPKRQDEYWASNKSSSLLFCTIHQRYYEKQYGCQLCFLATFEISNKTEHPEVKLLDCPICSKHSLFWNEVSTIYECLNLKCKNTFTFESLQKARQKPEVDPSAKAWWGNRFFDPKKRKWRKGK